jgi:nucleotide-binding universal stress UspA family protein
MKILVALDNSPVGPAVLAGARALAPLLDAAVEAVHVQVDGSRTAQTAAEAAEVPFRAVRGHVVERLVEEGGAADVVALAIGARGSAAARRPLGGTAAAVATALRKPVLVVPPDADPPAAYRRVLVPLEGTVSSSLAPRTIFELAAGAEIDVLALHVHDEESIPAFTDQPQHEQQTWTREFLRRYCPWGFGAVRLETRVGRSGELIPAVAEERGCDLIALGWSQELASGRAPVVRETLERTHRPVLLVPVLVAAEPDEGSAGTLPARTIHSGR